MQSKTLGQLTREIVWEHRKDLKGLTQKIVLDKLEQQQIYVNDASVGCLVSHAKANIKFLREIGVLEARYFVEEVEPVVDAAAKREARNARKRELRAAKKAQAVQQAAPKSEEQDDLNVIDFTQLAAA